MFIAVILGNVLSALMAFCGVVNIILFCCDGWEGMDVAIFMQKLFTVSLPLVIGSALFLLVQIATLIERQIITHMIEQSRGETKVYGRKNKHRSFGCAQDSFNNAEENHTPTGAISLEKSAAHNRQTPQSRVNASGPAATEHRHVSIDPATGRPMAADPAAMNPAAALASRGIQPGTFFHIEPVEHREPTSLPSPVPEAVRAAAEARREAETLQEDGPLEPPAPPPQAPEQHEGQEPQETPEQQEAPKPGAGLSFFRV